MAKDGTVRGGARAGTGPKKKAAAMQATISFPEGKKPEGRKMPKPRSYLKRKQVDGGKFGAEEIYKAAWEWLCSIGAEKFINPDCLERYSVAYARKIQAEEAISTFGLLGQHPTTQAPIVSQYITIAEKYGKQASAEWFGIMQTIRENAGGDFADKEEDMISQILNKAK